MPGPSTSAAPTTILAPPPPAGTWPAPPSEDESRTSSEGRRQIDTARNLTIPKLRLQIHDLTHDGAGIFLGSVQADATVVTAVRNVVRWLYHTSTSTVPGTRSVTIILRDMPGVAYTTGTDLDADHKEIHFSLRYIRGIAPARRGDEITGVLTHELVHCLQYNGRGTCPGGLVEGVADWVRLRCRLSPPHWKKDGSGPWDAGYQHTAYFLDYLEHRFGEGSVRRLNDKLRTQTYVEETFWPELLGASVDKLWGDYVDKLKEEEMVVVSREDAEGS